MSHYPRIQYKQIPKNIGEMQMDHHLEATLAQNINYLMKTECVLSTIRV